MRLRFAFQVFVVVKPLFTPTIEPMKYEICMYETMNTSRSHFRANVCSAPGMFV